MISVCQRVVRSFFSVFRPLKSNIEFIIRATAEHSWNLGKYAAIYKALLCFLRSFRDTDDILNPLLAGAVGGAWIYGRKTPLTSQMNLYVFSRVCMAMVELIQTRTPLPAWCNYRLFAGLTWAFIMFLFEYHKTHIVASLQSSMQYLYHNDRNLTGVTPVDFWNFFVQ